MTNQLLIDKSTVESVANSIRDNLNFDSKICPTEFSTLISDVANNSSKDIWFTSLKNKVKIGIKGKGKITLYINNVVKEEWDLLDGPYEDTFTRPEEADGPYLYQIDGSDMITELDIRDNEIDRIEFNSPSSITKLIMMNNKITKLDLKKCKELKYLHFYTNPICDSDDYRDNLIECMNSLPDRNGKSIGSILLYPWYGLETLICQVNGEYRKYPQTSWTDHHGKEHHAYNDLRCNLFDPPSSQTTNYVDMVSSGSDVILTAHNYTDNNGNILAEVAGKKWLQIQFPIRSANLLKNRTVTISCDSIVSSGKNSACCYIGHLRPDGSGTYDAIKTFQNSDDAQSASITFTYDDNMFILLYVNYNGEVADGDTATFKNLSLVCEDDSYKFVPGKLYGLVEGKDITSYYRGVSETSITPEDEITNHHQLRKRLEDGSDGTIKKNWVFGSAIQYHEDYKYCYHHFTNIGVQDVWETAEKGFGMCIGSCDQFRGRVYDWKDMNVLAQESRAGCGKGPYRIDGYHGDKILSHIMGRGNGYVYGICPNAQVYAIDNVGAGTWDSAADFLLNSPCTSLTYSYSLGQYNGMRYALGKFGEKSFVTEAAGNGGDDLPWSYEGSGSYCRSFGNYSSTDKDKSKYDLHTNTFFVNALSPLKDPSCFSNSSTDADYSYYGGFVPGDYLSHYGEQIAAYSPDTKSLSFINGTSMASPNCNATLSLMRIIYKKMNPECTLFGKDSKFMHYVEKNWMDRLEDNMTFSVGLGMPSFSCEPNNVQVNSTLPLTFSYPASISVGEPFDIKTSVSSGCKDEVSVNYKMSHFASKDSKLIPLTTFDESQIKMYTNTSIKDVTYSVDGVDGPSFKANYGMGSALLSCSTYSSTDNSIAGDDQDTRLPSSIKHFEWESGGYTYKFDCVKCEEYDGPMTIQFMTRLSPDVIPVGNDVSSSILYGNLFLIRRDLRDGTCSQCLSTAFKVSKYPDGKLHMCIPYTYPSVDEYGKPEDATNFFLYTNGCVGVKATSAERCRFENDDAFVVTLTYDPELGTNIYINATLVNHIIPAQPDSFRADDLMVPVSPLINDAAEDVYFFNRSLTHDEVLQNTITMLNKGKSV